MSVEQQWDIVSGVGITAVFVAAGRALETQREDRLINDPFAAVLTQAADSPIPLPETEGEADPEWFEAADYVGIRSRYFDDWFESACAGGVQQAVILASGLDTRAFRLSWPAGFTVFEIDQPKVLEFKQRVLGEQGVRAACEHSMVPVDLRDDWAAALEETSFDPRVPTAWLAEGLLPYLPSNAEQGLIDTVHRLSAPGSRLAVEDATPRSVTADLSAVREMGERWGMDPMDLFSFEDRPDPADLLAEHGWHTSKEATAEIVGRYGRKFSGPIAEMESGAGMLTAHRPY